MISILSLGSGGLTTTFRTHILLQEFLQYGFNDLLETANVISLPKFYNFAQNIYIGVVFDDITQNDNNSRLTTLFIRPGFSEGLILYVTFVKLKVVFCNYNIVERKGELQMEFI